MAFDMSANSSSTVSGSRRPRGAAEFMHCVALVPSKETRRLQPHIYPLTTASGRCEVRIRACAGEA